MICLMKVRTRMLFFDVKDGANEMMSVRMHVWLIVEIS